MEHGPLEADAHAAEGGVSEMHEADGALTCLSVLVRAPGERATADTTGALRLPSRSMAVLAIVSKGVFEKEARSGGRLLDVGEVWPTSSYRSLNPALEPLAAGGTLYLVTVRPGDVLWLVARLVAPQRGEGGWTAAPSTTPIRDVTGLVPKLRFASGKGVTAGPGKLGMSLQTPRELAAADVALLDEAARTGAPTTPQAAYAQVLEQAPAMQEAAAYAAGLAARAQAAGATGLRLDGHRRRARWSKLTAAEKRHLASLEEELQGLEEQAELELLDVIDEASGRATHLLALWPFGSGALVELATGELVADVVQHWFDARGDAALRERMAVAYSRAREALRIREAVTFTPGRDEGRAAPENAKGTGGAVERVRAMRRAIAAGQPPAQDALWTLVTEVLDLRKPRAIPVRRLFELDEATREALELIHEGYEESTGTLGSVGLPSSTGLRWRRDPGSDAGPLARFLGHAPPGPLDAPVTIDGQPHPAWCLVSDALHDVRPEAEVLARLATLPAGARSALWTALVRQPLGGPLTGAYARPPQGAQRGSPRALGTHAQRFVRFCIALAETLGEAGEEVARAVLAERAGWIDKWRPAFDANPRLDPPHGLDLCASLGTLARRARLAGGALDAEHDPALALLARGRQGSYPLAVVLAELPAERAGRLARAQLELMEQFPSPDSGAAAVQVLERWGGGPHYEAMFRRVIDAIGAPARPALLAAVERGSAQRAVLERCLAALDRAAKKKTLKKR